MPTNKAFRDSKFCSLILVTSAAWICSVVHAERANAVPQNDAAMPSPLSTLQIGATETTTSLEYADRLKSKAVNLIQQRKWDESKKTLQDAIFIYELNSRANGVKNREAKLPSFYKDDFYDPLTAAALAELAFVMAQTGQIEQSTTSKELSEKLGKKSVWSSTQLAEWKKLLTDAVPENDGWSDKGDEKLLGALQYVQKVEPEGAATVTTLWALSNWYASRAKYAEATATAAKALTIEEKCIGQSNPAICDLLCSYASNSKREKNYAKAEELYERANTIYASYLPDSDFRRTDILTALFELHRDQGRLDKAALVKAKLLSAVEKESPHSASVAAGSRQLAEMYLSSKHYDAAEQALTKAFGLDERSNRKAPLTDALKMAEIKTRLNKFTEAETIYKSAVLRCEQERLKDLDVVLEKYAEMLRQSGRTTEAEALEARARQFRIDGGRKLWH